MSIFDLFRTKPAKDKPSISREDVEREMYEKNTMGFRDTKDHLNYQNALLDRVNKAREKYKEDGDLDAVIKDLEYAFIEADPPCNSSQNMVLADYYIKANKRDKAWGYLNMLQAKQLAPLEKVRFAQARILKAEKKYSYAIEMYACGYLAKSKWNNTFQKDMFLKDIQSSANKLNWDDDRRDQVASIIEKAIKKRNYDEGVIIKQYREFIESIG